MKQTEKAPKISRGQSRDFSRAGDGARRSASASSASSRTREGMSERAHRGGEYEVSEHAALTPEAAQRWRRQRDAIAAEAATREADREECLWAGRCGGVAGGAAGAGVTGTVLYRMRRRPPAWLAAFVVWCGVYMPFMFVSQVVQVKCQRRTLAAREAARRTAAGAEE